jgi:hypothetical protein
LVRKQRVIWGNPESDQPTPTNPFGPWLVYSNDSDGAKPAVPGGSAIGIEYVPAPVGLTAALPGSDMTPE